MRNPLLLRHLIAVLAVSGCALAGSIHGINRPKCEEKDALQKFVEEKELTKVERRVEALRNEMRSRSSSQGEGIEAFIVTSFDEHQTFQTDDNVGRLEFISGFTGPVGDAVITMDSSALWTEIKYLEAAERELDCHWKIFIMGEDPTPAMWLAKQLSSDKRVGVDPFTTPHHLWQEWERDLGREFLRLVKVRNLIDTVFGHQTRIRDYSIKTHNSSYSGLSWQNKSEILKDHLRKHRCDAMVVTSLTEIAYLLNLRGGDFRYVPVFRAYLVVSHWDMILYTNRTKITPEAEIMLNFDFKTNSCFREKCVQIKDYHDIWQDLRGLSLRWKRVLLPSMSVFDMGVSEAIYTTINREIIFEHSSPVIAMRAQKNEVERRGMQWAHVKDAVAMIDTLSYLEERVVNSGDTWTEAVLALEIDRSRYQQQGIKGLAFQTVVAFGPNGAKPYYYPHENKSSEIKNNNMILIDSGGQFLDGTTSVARTVHIGEPTSEQRKAYTSVLTGLIRLSMLVFPDGLKPSEIDTLIRGPVWGNRQDYQHLSGNGIGSYLSAEESPINIAYTTKHKYVFKDGYFFTAAPGYYIQNKFGIRLKNVFEVIDTEDKHFAGGKYLAFRVTTLVPFETKLIERSMLSLQEKKWLNEYNARIREIVGDELKKQFKMPAFYWLMNQTEHIREYMPESEYRKNDSPKLQVSLLPLIFILSSLKLF